MAVSIPIVSEFYDKGVKQAIKKFRQLETTGQKAQFALKAAAVPATAALAGLAKAGWDAAQAAIADEAAQANLAKQLQASLGATDAVVASAEDWITAQGRATGITDDELRPALAKLARVTEDLGAAQDAVLLGQDIAVAKGMDLATVTDALEKAYGGNFKALRKIAPELGDMIKNGASLDDVMKELNKKFGGSAQKAAETTAGRFKTMNTRFSEMKEELGARLLPVFERLLPYLEKFADWAEKNPAILGAIVAVMGALAAAIVAVNIAMMMNPAVAIVAGIMLLVGALVVAYKKFEWFRNGVKTVMGVIEGYFKTMIKVWEGIINKLIQGYNFVNNIWGGKDIPLLGQSNPAEASAARFRMQEQRQRGTGAIQGPYLAGPGNPTGTPFARGASNITVNVTNNDPQAVVRALQTATRRNGSLAGIGIR